MKVQRGGLAGALLIAALASAQERPSEDAMFGGPDTAPTAGAPADGGMASRPDENELFGNQAPPAAAAAATLNDGGVPTRDESSLFGTPGVSMFDTDEAKNDALKVGGTLYIRSQVNAQYNVPFENTPINVPGLVDLYLDARPNDRLRGFVLGRLRYDPTQGATTAGSLQPTVGNNAAQNPSVALDQMWLRFDLYRKVFFTVGRQKAKWGTGRLWQPTDFLNAQRRDPLVPFDLRLGINALKIHVPIESLGWNFYAYGLLDNNGPANLLGNLGGALRGEFVLGPAEVGVGGVWVKGRRPRYGIDLSTPLGPVDVYGEVAFRDGRDFTRYTFTGKLDPERPEEAFGSTSYDGVTIQATAGVSYSINYTELHALVFGAEYFYNPMGATHPVQYLPQIFNGEYNPFYAGQHYVGVFATTPGLPGFTWITLALNALLNLSDPTGVVRVDAFFRVLSFLQIETFASVNFGAPGGEFRFGGDFPALNLPTTGPTPAFNIPYPVASFGLGLRLSL